LSGELPTRYDPQATEPKWIEAWAKAKVGRADPRSEAARQGRVFTIFIPPPNVTGVLHMGHAMNETLQDVLTRFHRMRGFETLWLPGTDHAGIATQNVVERQLAKERRTRHDLGREAFVAEVWRWKEEYEARILGQVRRLGNSPDWDRLRFTMDDGLTAAVRHVFVDLYHRGYIYRGLRLVNWCPRCTTAISDDEVTYEDVDGRLYWIRYPWADGSDGGLTVATTRPETMLGDTAVAVNPEDARYASLVGRKLRLPLVGREIPVVADGYVDKSFGAGALKVTPAHDPNDWEIGRRHKLPAICVIALDGSMSKEAPEAYRGLDRFEARKRVAADLEAAGLLVKVDPHPHSVGTCDRCHSIIEPLPSEQWFVRMRERSPNEPDRPSLAERAIAATREGRVRLVPERWTSFYMGWLDTVRDWCISRQLWWGHRIPVFTCTKCGHVDAFETDPPACPKCASPMKQDDDVLDTWFSSDLWPLSTIGWPRETEELSVFYPSSVLITDRGILYLWVARMVMMGELYAPTVKTRATPEQPGGGTEPFRDVYVHGTILDKQGRKMSKSLGNGIDPLEMIERYGADAVRFTLVWMTTEGQDLKLDETRFEMGRNFMNKLWNAARFALGAAGDAKPAAGGALAVEDRWIRTELTRTQREVTSLLAAYKFSGAAQAIYEFTWNQFCDWYLELIKPRIQAGGAAADGAKATLVHVLAGVCRMLHPVAPHLTEELWEHLRPWHAAPSLLARSPWGEETLEDAAAGLAIASVQETVRAVRNLRAESRVPEKETVDVLLVPKPGADAAASAVAAQSAQILRLCQASSIRVERAAPPKEHAVDRGSEAGDRTGVAKPAASGSADAAGARYASAVTSLGDVFIDLAGKIDVAAERQRLAKEHEKAQKSLAATKAKLANDSFVTRAKPEVVEQERRRLAEAEEQCARLAKLLDALGR
jgi:valyl-tRNA synthetase